MTQKYFSSFYYCKKKSGEKVSLLVHFVFFTAYFSITNLVFLLQKTASFFLSHVFVTGKKSNLYLCLFSLAYMPFYTNQSM